MYFNDSIPNCVPDFYLEQREKYDREYELAHKLDDYYAECRAKLEEAYEKGRPVLWCGGYAACWECDKKCSIMRNAEDDMDLIICEDASCAWHDKDYRKQFEQEDDLRW